MVIQYVHTTRKRILPLRPKATKDARIVETIGYSDDCDYNGAPHCMKTPNSENDHKAYLYDSFCDYYQDHGYHQQL